MKNIKKDSQVVILSIITVFLFSCGTTKHFYDKDLSQERTARLSFGTGLILKSYNGEDIKLKKRFLSNDTLEFTIPAGNTTLVYDLYVGIGNTIYRARNIELKYNFEAGREYEILFWSSDEDGNIHMRNVLGFRTRHAGIHIIDKENKKKALYKVPLQF